MVVQRIFHLVRSRSCPERARRPPGQQMTQLKLLPEVETKGAPNHAEAKMPWSSPQQCRAHELRLISQNAGARAMRPYS